MSAPVPAKRKALLTKLDRDPKAIDEMVASLRAGMSHTDAAILAGFHPKQVQYWYQMGRHEADRIGAGGEPFIENTVYFDFYLAISRAIPERKRILLGRIFTASQTDWRAAQWILERQYPNEFGAARPEDWREAAIREGVNPNAIFEDLVTQFERELDGADDQRRLSEGTATTSSPVVGPEDAARLAAELAGESISNLPMGLAVPGDGSGIAGSDNSGYEQVPDDLHATAPWQVGAGHYPVSRLSPRDATHPTRHSRFLQSSPGGDVQPSDEEPSA